MIIAALFVAALVGTSCDSVAPAPKAVAPEAVAPTPPSNSERSVKDTAPVDSADEPGAAARPKMPAPNPEHDAKARCEPMQKDAALLAARCFKLVPDKPACTSFFAAIETLQAAGCDTGKLKQGERPAP